MTKLEISAQIFRKFPKLSIGIVIAKNIGNAEPDRNVHRLLKEAEALIKKNFASASLAQHPLISPWRAAYSSFGSKPSKYNSSIESMMRRIAKTSSIPRINKLVDLCNYLSLNHTLPIGIYDLERIEGDISLNISKGTEIFRPLGTEQIHRPEKNEVIYKDSRKVLCRRWNWHDCEETKITENTKSAVLCIEALPPVTEDALKEACEETSDLIKRFCNGEARYFTLDVGKPEIGF